MSTAPVTLKIDVSTPVSTQRVHSKWVGNTLMFCIQPNCDGVHHWYCGCAPSR